MTLAPWDNSGLRDRLGGAETPSNAEHGVELELCEVARRRDDEQAAKRSRRRLVPLLSEAALQDPESPALAPII